MQTSELRAGESGSPDSLAEDREEFLALRVPGFYSDVFTPLEMKKSMKQTSLGHALVSSAGGAGGEAEGEVTMQCHLNTGLR